MRTLLLTCCLLRIAYSSAQLLPGDSIAISLSNHLPADTSVILYRSAVDGVYSTRGAFSTPSKKLPKIPGMISINPVELYDARFTLQITSRPDLERSAPFMKVYVAHPKPEPPVEEPEIDTISPSELSGTVLWNSYMDGVYIRETLPDPEVCAFYHADGQLTEIVKPYVKYNRVEAAQAQREVDSVSVLFEEECRLYRSKSVQPVVDSLLQPFWLSEHEVTNAEYRRFVNWVKDSVAFEFLYREVIADDDAAFRMLQTPDDAFYPGYFEDGYPVEIDESDRELNRNYFPFDYTALNTRKANFYELYHAELLGFLYLTQAERFYKKLEVDKTKLIYASAAISPTPIYPDTLCWLRDSKLALWDAYTNMYFWHPAYDNYPVVGLNERQMQAYCDWLQKTTNQELARRKAGYTVKATLPGLFHYEMAVRSCAQPGRRSTIDTAPEDPLILHRDEREAAAFVVSTRPVPVDHHVSEEGYRKLVDWTKINQTTPFPYLLGGVSEYCADCDTEKDTMTVLGANRLISVIDPHENQLNTAFYRQKIPAGRGSANAGFRIVYYLDKR